MNKEEKRIILIMILVAIILQIIILWWAIDGLRDLVERMFLLHLEINH